MTKKAAKKKQVTKKAPKDSPEKDASDSISKDDRTSQPPSEKPKTIEVVEERASEAQPPQRKSGRVKSPETGKRTESSRQRSGNSRRGGRRSGGSRPNVDLEELSKKAWKVFAHEIAEEGLALLDETSARQLAEKSIAVTRAFLEERDRRLGQIKSADSRPDPRDERDAGRESASDPERDGREDEDGE